MHFSYSSVAVLTFVAFYFWQNCKIYLCATKYDLIQDNPEQRAVPYSAAKSLADGRHVCPCCDVHICVLCPSDWMVRVCVPVVMCICVLCVSDWMVGLCIPVVICICVLCPSDWMVRMCVPVVMCFVSI